MTSLQPSGVYEVCYAGHPRLLSSPQKFAGTRSGPSHSHALLPRPPEEPDHSLVELQLCHIQRIALCAPTSLCPASRF